jgi:hypothetical protein
MKKNIVKKVLKETKDKKDRLLIEQDIVTNRMMVIFESKDNIKYFHLLSEQKKRKIAFAVLNEINYLSSKGILNEQLIGFLKRLLGNSFGSVIETIAEPLVNSILSGLGLSGVFKNFLVSTLTSNPTELGKALTDCKTLTTLIANSLSEALVMTVQEKLGLTGSIATFLRNALGGAIKDEAFVNKIEEFIGDTVCSSFSNLSKNAEGVLGKLKNLGLGLGGG